MQNGWPEVAAGGCKQAKGVAIKFLKSFFHGIIYGGLSPIPGVSAGTLAIFFNNFEDVLHSASAASAKKNWHVLLIFFAGWGAGLWSVSHLIIFLLENHGRVTLFGAMGLILGCVPAVFQRARSGKAGFRNAVFFALPFAFMLFLNFNEGELAANASLEQLGGLDAALAAWIFIAAFFSAIAMLIPGVGGSLMMLSFGIYAIYLEAVNTLDPLLLALLTVSMILGILAGIKLIKKLLDSYSQALYSAILGFILGAVFFIFPGLPYYLGEGVLSFALALSFAVLAYWLSHKEGKKI